MANLFDVGIVFALGFLVALMSHLGPQQVLGQIDAASRQAPSVEETQRIQQYRMSDERVGGEGVRLGAAYRLPTGEIVCVPDEGS